MERVRLSFKEKRELEALPAQIEALEAEQEALTQKLLGVDYHKLPVEEIKADKERIEALPALIEAAYERWEELTQKEALASR